MTTEHAKASRSIKQELIKAFPGVVFSVKSKGYSGGNSVDVFWTDGPTTKEVDAIIGKYQQGHFDGMTDCYEYNSHRPATNGTTKYAFANRHISAEGYTAMIKDLCKLNSVDYQADEWRINIGGNGNYNETACHIINSIMSKHNVPAGAKIIGLERTACTCGLIEEFYRPIINGGNKQ